MSYQEELTKAMTWLGQQPDTVFIGQGVKFPGHGMFPTLAGVPGEKLVELPVAEDMQMGMGTGMALAGKTVISIYPRFDFLLLAMNQLVNHLDKLGGFTHGQFKAKVIVRVGVGADVPLNPGCQHVSDYTLPLMSMLNLPVVPLRCTDDVFKEYKAAYFRDGSTLLVEYMGLYGMV